MNYQLKMEEIINNLDYVPTLLLHACCAPCSSYVLTQLSKYFKITIFYYNPNIYPESEFSKRYDEIQNFVSKISSVNLINVVRGKYENDLFEEKIKDYKNLGEGSYRCSVCFKLRLEKSVLYAKENGFDYFTTTLSISPYKNSKVLNKIGEELENEYGIKYLYSDFKKKEGTKKANELAKEYNLYRQDYCGCIYSKKERKEKK